MIGDILNIVNKFIPDQDKAKQVALQLEKEYTKQMEMQSDIIKAEQKNGSGKWRVRLMYLCMIMVLGHWIMYDIVPYSIEVMDLDYLVPDAPDSEHLWDFLKIGVGGYIASRGVEKSVAHFKG